MSPGDKKNGTLKGLKRIGVLFSQGEPSSWKKGASLQVKNDEKIVWGVPLLPWFGGGRKKRRGERSSSYKNPFTQLEVFFKGSHPMAKQWVRRPLF